jgi:signal transduction histidine kinase
MKWISALRTASPATRRTAILLGPAIFALIAVVATSLWLVGETARQTRIIEETSALRGAARNILITLLDAETGQRGYLLTRKEAYLGPYNSALSDVAAQRQQLLVLRDDADVAGDVDRLLILIDQKKVELTSTVKLAQTGRRAEALAVVETDRGKAVMDEIRIIAGKLSDTADGRLKTGLVTLKQNADGLALTTQIGAVLILTFAGGAIWIMMRQIQALGIARRQVEILNAGLEQRVSDRTAALTQANDEIQRFAYIVSHDLRAPLVNVMGFTAELTTGLESVKAHMDKPDDPQLAAQAHAAIETELPEALRFIRSATDRMDRLINAILRLSRNGRRELSPEPINLKQALESAAMAVQHQLGLVSAETNVNAPAITIVSDKLALDQVFGNLVDNAVKYLDPKRPGRIDIGARRIGDRIMVSITDNGRGIAPQDHERIFELFRRSGVQDRPGDGIGLAHTRTLIRRLGGQITLSSRLGEGTTFHVELPLELEGVGIG